MNLTRIGRAALAMSPYASFPGMTEVGIATPAHAIGRGMHWYASASVMQSNIPYSGLAMSCPTLPSSLSVYVILLCCILRSIVWISST